MKKYEKTQEFYDKKTERLKRELNDQNKLMSNTYLIYKYFF